MKLIKNYAVILIAIMIIGCEGKHGPVGPAGSLDIFSSLMPYNPQPPDGGSINRLNDLIDGKILLSWSIIATTDQEIKYDIYFGNSIPPPIMIENTGDPFGVVEYTDLSIYFWRIIVKNGDGVASLGPLWRFIDPLGN